MTRPILVTALLLASTSVACDCDGDSATAPTRGTADEADVARCEAATAAAREAVDVIHADYRERAGRAEASADELRNVGDACRAIRVQLRLADTAARLQRAHTSTPLAAAVDAADGLPEAEKQTVVPLLREAFETCP